MVKNNPKDLELFQSEIDQARIEQIKKFPEMVIRSSRVVEAVCARCHKNVKLDHECLFGFSHEGSAVGIRLEDQRRCPHCGSVGDAERKYISESNRTRTRVHYLPISHFLITATDHVLEERVGWFGKRTPVKILREIIAIERIGEFPDE